MNRADHVGSRVLDRVLVIEMVRVTEAAAIEVCGRFRLAGSPALG
jgi:hypothetical protein